MTHCTPTHLYTLWMHIDSTAPSHCTRCPRNCVCVCTACPSLADGCEPNEPRPDVLALHHADRRVCNTFITRMGRGGGDWSFHRPFQAVEMAGIAITMLRHPFNRMISVGGRVCAHVCGRPISGVRVFRCSTCDAWHHTRTPHRHSSSTAG